MTTIPPKMHLAPADEDQFATFEEAEEAIRALTPDQIAKLMTIAKYWAAKRLRSTSIEPGDLLHDAIVKTIDRAASRPRRWNKSVSLVKHLDRVMESDSGHAYREAREAAAAKRVDEEGATEPGADFARIAAEEELREVLPLFDEEALAVLRLKAEEYTAVEIREKLELDERAYDTITRRIRRIRVQLMKGGS